MPVTITPEQRRALVRCKRRPVTLRQYYAARSLLALAQGRPLPQVAKALGRSESQVERWSVGFEKAGVQYLARLGRKNGRPEMPPIDALLRMTRKAATEGIDLDADPADLY